MRIEHPLRNLQDRKSALVIGSTPKHQRTSPDAHRVHKDLPPMPRMESIANLTNVDTYGSFVAWLYNGELPHFALRYLTRAEFLAGPLRLLERRTSHLRI